LVVSLLLALAGITGLVTAIVLVPSMVRQFAAARNAEASPVVHETAKSPDPIPDTVATVDVVQAVEVEQKVEAEAEQKVEEEAEQKVEAEAEQKVEAEVEQKVEEAAPATDSETQWTIELDPGNYEILEGGETTVDAIVHFLTTNESAKVKLTGVNHINKSSKRSKQAARIIKEEIIRDVGVARHRVSIAGTQEQEVTGLLVRAEIMGGGR